MTNLIDYSETETRTRFITPKLYQAGWDERPYTLREEFTITLGRIDATKGEQGEREEGMVADYLLRYGPDRPLAVVEAKRYKRDAGDGIQQAKTYAQKMQVKFAYATNGREIIEFNFITGEERYISAFPNPAQLIEMADNADKLSQDTRDVLNQPGNYGANFIPRYYQQIAINRVLTAITQRQENILLTMATGTGKTFVAFQICWKLTQAKWNRKGRLNTEPRILFLADRKKLIDDPKDKTFLPFGDARHKISKHDVVFSRQMYFALYQGLYDVDDDNSAYREFDPDFFDLIIVDEAHRGSASEESSWRSILDYFEPAYKLGLTATPKRDANVDTYDYFGNPVYEYSLKQGIEDGFLAPYTVHRVVTNFDRDGWRPSPGDVDKDGNPLEDRLYTTADFERIIAIRPRTEAIAKHLNEFMRVHGRFQKTIIFCVDQLHALQMKEELAKLNKDLVKKYPNYVARITSAEGVTGDVMLDDFQDHEKPQPVIVTTSKLLSTGVDIPTCKNIVLVRNIGSMVEFKQIIGRGTRIKDEQGKLFFNIIDYAGSATEKFNDPDFDGYPAHIVEENIDENGNVTSTTGTRIPSDSRDDGPPSAEDRTFEPRHKIIVNQTQEKVEIIGESVYKIGTDGRRLQPVKYTDYTSERVRVLYPDPEMLRKSWIDPDTRQLTITHLQTDGVDFEMLADILNQPDADPFDLLLYVAFNTPIMTRRDRANRLKKQEREFIEQFSDQARAILVALLDKYAEYGTDEFRLPDVLQLPPVSEYGNIQEIIDYFGGPDQLKQAVQQLQALLYAA